MTLTNLEKKAMLEQTIKNLKVQEYLNYIDYLSNKSVASVHESYVQKRDRIKEALANLYEEMKGLDALIEEERKLETVQNGQVHDGSNSQG